MKRLINCFIIVIVILIMCICAKRALVAQIRPSYLVTDFDFVNND